MDVTDAERQVIGWARHGASLAARVLDDREDRSRAAVAELVAALRAGTDDQAYETVMSMMSLTAHFALDTTSMAQLRLLLAYATRVTDKAATMAIPPA